MAQRAAEQHDPQGLYVLWLCWEQGFFANLFVLFSFRFRRNVSRLQRCWVRWTLISYTEPRNKEIRWRKG